MQKSRPTVKCRDCRYCGDIKKVGRYGGPMNICDLDTAGVERYNTDFKFTCTYFKKTFPKCIQLWESKLKDEK